MVTTATATVTVTVTVGDDSFRVCGATATVTTALSLCHKGDKFSLYSSYVRVYGARRGRESVG
jgi:hypothetical protein